MKQRLTVSLHTAIVIWDANVKAYNAFSKHELVERILRDHVLVSWHEIAEHISLNDLDVELDETRYGNGIVSDADIEKVFAHMKEHYPNFHVSYERVSDFDDEPDEFVIRNGLLIIDLYFNFRGWRDHPAVANESIVWQQSYHTATVTIG